MNEIIYKRLAFILLVLSFVLPACASKALGPVDVKKVSTLHEAVKSDNTARAMDLIAKGVDINEADSTGMTPLGIAVGRQSVEMVRMLLDQGADVRAGNGEEGTALLLAVRGRSPTEESSVEIADLLISRGADLEATAPDSPLTPLHQAAAWYRVNIAELLIKRGANVNSRPDGARMPGATPLHIAVDLRGRDPSYKPAERMVKLLLDHGANVHIRTRFDGATPLHAALTNRPANANIVRMLIDHGSDVNARLSPSSDAVYYRQFDGDTPLHRAVFHREAEIVEILLSRGAVINAKNAKGMTPLALARAWEERSRKWENPDPNIGYQEVINLLKRYGGRE